VRYFIFALCAVFFLPFVINVLAASLPIWLTPYSTGASLVLLPIFVWIVIRYGEKRELPNNPERININRALRRKGIPNFRLLLDRLLPGFHFWLTEREFLEAPSGLSAANLYLRHFRIEMENLNQDQYYPLDAKPVGSSRPAYRFPFGLRGDYIKTVRQVIRIVLGQGISGYSATARLAALTRRSRIIRNIPRTLLSTRTPLILLGDPGTGKSMTLRETGKRIAERELKRVYPVIPIYIRLGDFAPEGDPDAHTVIEFIRATISGEISFLFDDLISERRLVILFDGMDEMNRKWYGNYVTALSEFAALYSQYVKTLFSCRINDFSPEFHHQQLVLLPFGPRQIKAFIRSRINELIEIDGHVFTPRQITNYLLSNDMSEHMANPMMLSITCWYIQVRGAWPASRAELFGFLFDEFYERYEHEQKKRNDVVLGRDKVFSYWGRIAFRIARANTGPWITLTPTRLRVKIAEFAQLITEGVRCGVLVIDDLLEKGVDSGAQRVRFAHHRYQEYFAALRLLRAPAARLNWLNFLDEPSWQETMINLSALTGRCPAGEVLLSCMAQVKLASKKKPLSITVPGIAEVVHRHRYGQDEAETEALAERILADRVDLVAQIVSQVGRRAGVTGKQLRDALLTAIQHLSEIGNPSTQVRMLWAASTFADLDLYNIIQAQLTSSVSWVRDQALILVLQTNANRDKNAGHFEFRVGTALSSGEFLFRIRPYFRTALASRRPQALWCVASGTIASSVYIAGLVGTVVLCGISARSQLPLLSTPYGVSSYFFFVVLMCTYMIRYELVHLHVAVAISAVVSLSTLLLLEGFANGDLSVTQTAISWFVFDSVVWVGVAVLLHCLMIGIYLTLSVPALKPFKSLAYSIYQPLAGSYRRFFLERDIEWVVPLTFFLILAKTGLILALTGVAGVGGSRILLPFSSHINVIVSLGILTLAIAFLLSPIADERQVREKLRVWANDGWVWVLVAGVGYTLSYFLSLERIWWVFWQWLVAYGVPVWAGYVLSGSIILSATAGCIWLGYNWIWKNLTVSWQIRRARRNPPLWYEQFLKADSHGQAKLLSSTNHQLLGLSPRAYSLMLLSVEAAVRPDPAKSQYWSVRHQVEQIVRQETL
jgi:hypothetical protein